MFAPCRQPVVPVTVMPLQNKNIAKAAVFKEFAN
jgi:hypothetical protein